MTEEGLIKVSPGVAIDSQGRLIALSDEDAGGQGIVGTIDPADDEYAGLGPKACVTIRYWTQDPPQKSKRNKSLTDLRVQPLVSLEDPTTLGDDTDVVVLAVVELGPDRTIKQLAPTLDGVKLARKLVGVPAGEIRLRRSESTTKDGQPPAVRDTVAVTLRPTKEGNGVEIDGMAKVKAIEVQDKVTTKDLEVTGEVKFPGRESAGLDYQKAQFTMSGGGTVTWSFDSQSKTGRLKWTQRFIAIGVGGNADYPKNKDAVKSWDKKDQWTDAGIELHGWDSLYAIQQVGGDVEFQIYGLAQAEIEVPSNWLPIAVVNSEDGTVKLGTGVIISANSSSSNGCPLPCGTILMWSGKVDAIPDGWALCDGGKGTPNLTRRFIMGAGKDPDSAPGLSGEADGHTHHVDIPRTVTSNDGYHSHSFPSDWSITRGTRGADNWQHLLMVDKDLRTLEASGGHTHVVDPADTQTSPPSPGENKPRWYALCFIMKL